MTQRAARAVVAETSGGASVQSDRLIIGGPHYARQASGASWQGSRHQSRPPNRNAVTLGQASWFLAKALTQAACWS